MQKADRKQRNAQQNRTWFETRLKLRSIRIFVGLVSRSLGSYDSSLTDE